jgi:hypothetical protein
MVQPFDYTTTIGNPGGAFQQAYAQGLQLQAVQEAQAMARMEAQRKAAEQQQLRAAMTAFAAAKTPAEKVSVMERYPMFAKPISEQYNAMDEMTRKPVFDAGLRGYAALRGGDAASAARVWRETGTAFANSNKPELAKQFNDLAVIAEKDPGAADIMSSAFLAGTDGKRFKEFGEVMGQGSRTTFQKDLVAAGIDPESPEGKQLSQQFVKNRADPIVEMETRSGGRFVGPRSEYIKRYASEPTNAVRLPIVSNQQQYDNLPPGNYLDPQGNVRTKR